MNAESIAKKEIRTEAVVAKIPCPYCMEKPSASPMGVRFHVAGKHPDKLEDFDENYLPKLKEEYKQKL